jgi:hypothetical protein
MEQNGIEDSDQLEKKLKELNDNGQDISKVNIPKLRRRQSHLLTPIFMDKDGAELVAGDYEGTEEYQRKVQEVYQMDYDEFIHHPEFNQPPEETFMNEKQMLGKATKDEKMVVEKPQMNMQMPLPVKDLDNDPSFQKKMIPQKLEDSPSEMMKQKLQNLVDTARNQKQRNISDLENVITETIIENFDRLPKTGETKSEGYLNELKNAMRIEARNNQILKEKLGIDLDEDDLSMDSSKQEEIKEYLKKQFVLLRTTPLKTPLNKHFRNVFGTDMNQSLCDNAKVKRGTILGRSKSFSHVSKSVGLTNYEPHTETINLIEKKETIILTNEDNFKENLILQDGLSNNSDVEFTIEEMGIKEIAKQKMMGQNVDVMYSRNDFEDQEEIYNPEVSFIQNPKLSEEERTLMIKKIIQITNFIEMNKIKVDFELYTDSTIFINMPDLQLSELLNNLNMIVEAGTSDQIPVIITSEVLTVPNDQSETSEDSNKSSDELETKQILVEQKSEHKRKEYTAEITLEIPGYTKEQVQQMIVLMMEEEGFLTVNETVINDERQEQLDKLHLMDYDVTDYLANDLKNI